MNLLMSVALAILVDLAIGDPVWISYPVVVMGKNIRRIERRFNRWETDTAVLLRLKGILLTVMITLGSALITGIIWLATWRLSHILGVVLNIWMISTTIAWKGLVKAGREVFRTLTVEGLDAGRRSVGMIVGRDTGDMTEPDVVRATVETLAENIVDAIVSPVLYAALGGAPLAMFYRATNTLDSMVGYRNNRYQYFGWASARLDDVLNYIPARLTVILIYSVLCFRRSSAGTAWTIMLRDAKKHPSPNSGLPEAIVAGGLGVQLGGINQYAGIASFRAHLGDPIQGLTPESIIQTIRIVTCTGWILFSLITVGGAFVWLSSVGPL